MYNILGAGKPILAIAAEDSELAQVIEEARVGWHVRPGDREKAAQTIREAAEAGHAVLSEMSRRARALVVQEYTETQITQKIGDLLRSSGLSFSQSWKELS
jgi:glycosyltransferase involved in cell wall biosynthesis